MHTISSTILCIYHAPCNDGAASAAALEHRLLKAGRLGPEDALEAEIRFCPLTYTTDWDEPLPESQLENLIHADHPVSEIYMVDVTISKVKYDQIVEHLHATEWLGTEKPHTVAIDHHVSARDREDELRTFCEETYIHIGPGLSGATLVWKYFNERLGDEQPMPLLLQYVADQDIWEWKLPDSREVNAALNVLDGTVETMEEELATSMTDPDAWLERRRAEGRAITSMVDSQIQRSARNVADLPLGTDARLLVVNATSFSSELGNTLCEDHESSPNVVALIYTIQENWSVRCSLRSIPGGTHTARSIAERYGGGGHDHAAGCRFESYEEFRKAVEELNG